jgi:hypothetical protein
MQSAKEILEAKIFNLRQELNKITDAEDDAENAALVGRFFKTQNNYSCPKKKSDYWTLYVRVTSSTDGLKGITSQVDKDGRVSINPDEFYVARTILSHEEITAGEYAEAWTKMMKKIQGYAA